jgi:hypothetical protein
MTNSVHFPHEGESILFTRFYSCLNSCQVICKHPCSPIYSTKLNLYSILVTPVPAFTIPVPVLRPFPQSISGSMPPGNSSTLCLRVPMPSSQSPFYHPRFLHGSFTSLCSRNRLFLEDEIEIWAGSESRTCAGTGGKSHSTIRRCGLKSGASRRTQSGSQRFWLGQRMCRWTLSSTVLQGQVQKRFSWFLHISPILADSTL